MVKIKVYIGDSWITTEDMDIKLLFRFNDVLRKFSMKYEDGLRIDWRGFAFKSELISNLLKIDISGDFIRKLDSYLDEALKTSPDYLMKEGNVLIAVKDYNYKEIADTVKTELEIEEVDSSLGKIQLGFLRFSPSDILMLRTKRFPDKFMQIVEKIIKKQEERKVVVYSSGSTHIAVNIPLFAKKELVEEIKSLGIIEYYVQDENGEFVLQKENVYSISKDRDGITIFLPAYALAFIPDIVAKHGYIFENKVKVKSTLNINLRRNFDFLPHQKEAVEEWMKNKKGVIVIPTGGGKTFIGMGIIDLLKVPTLILVPNKILLWQWRNRIAKYLGVPQSEIGILGGGESKIADITVSTYQSGVRNKEKLAKRFMLLICDESHHVPAKTFKEVALYSAAPYRLALSATPKRYDKNEILLFKLMGGIVYEIKYQDLVMMGILAPMAVRKIIVDLPWEIKERYKELEKKLDSAISERERRMLLNKLIEIARDNPAKLEVIREIVKRHKNDKMFIFAGSIKFAKDIAEKIKDLIPVAVLTAETPPHEEKKIGEDFAKGRIRALVLVKKGEEGLDVGDASVAIIAGGSKQVREFIQRVGRVLRGGRDKLAWVYEIVTRGTVEEAISKARRARNLVRGIEDFVRKNFGVKAYRVIKWPAFRLS